MKNTQSEKDGKTALLGSSFGSVLLVAAGLILLFNPDFGSAAVAVIIGWILVAAGALGILVSILSWPVLGVPEILIFALGLGLGIYLLNNPLSLASILGFALGAWLAIQGIAALVEALRLKKAGYSFTADLVLALVMVVLGVVLIFSPLTTSRVVMCLCGLGMVVCGVMNLVVRARAAKLLQEYQRKRKIIDADE